MPFVILRTKAGQIYYENLFENIFRICLVNNLCICKYNEFKVKN